MDNNVKKWATVREIKQLFIKGWIQIQIGVEYYMLGNLYV